MAIFISYRRNDSADITGRMFQSLQARFPEEVLYYDKISIAVGTDFAQDIENELHDSDIVLAIIGPGWKGKLASKGASKKPRYRIMEKNDRVRLELERALALQKRIIPILVNGAALPSERDIPETLATIRKFQALEVRGDPLYTSDMDQLYASIKQALPVANKKLIEIYPSCEEACIYLQREYVKRSQVVNEATLIQYSSTFAFPLIRDLLKKGAQVTLYIQDEETARLIGSQEQVARIAHRYTTMKADLGPIIGGSLEQLLHIYKYVVPASLNAVRIDNKILLVGWYIYEEIDEIKRNERRHNLEDTVEISGHDIPCIVVWDGIAEYDDLNKLFTRLEENLLRNSEPVLL